MADLGEYRRTEGPVTGNAAMVEVILEDEVGTHGVVGVVRLLAAQQAPGGCLRSEDQRGRMFKEISLP